MLGLCHYFYVHLTQYSCISKESICCLICWLFSLLEFGKGAVFGYCISHISIVVFLSILFCIILYVRKGHRSPSNARCRLCHVQKCKWKIREALRGTKKNLAKTRDPWNSSRVTFVFKELYRPRPRGSAYSLASSCFTPAGTLYIGSRYSWAQRT
jgi:hypothetical protein